MWQRLCKMASKIPAVKLNNGKEMPIVGLGTWKSKPGEVTEAVKTAIDLGYRHIDCALIYGNENEVGAALKAKFAEGIKREDLFITSKLWNSYHLPEDVRPSLMESLKNLGLDYLDLYLIHWPWSLKPGCGNFPRDEAGNLIYADINPVDTYKAMEKLVEEGLVKSIGVSNFNSEQVKSILDNCSIKPVTNQVELHPYFPNEKLVKFCHDLDVSITAYSPLGSGDRPWAKPDEPTLLNDETLKAIGAKYNKSPAQVVIRWVIQRGIIVIPKSVTPSRIKENFDVFDFELSAEDMAAISAFDKNVRLVIPKIPGTQLHRDKDAPYYPFNIEF